MRFEEFEGHHVDEASALLAMRLRLEPQARMSAIQPNEDLSRRHLTAALAEGAQGTAVMDRRGMAGYLLAVKGDNDRGRHVWLPREGSGHRDDPEVLRHAYAWLANDWVDEGRDHHYAVVSAQDAGVLDAWFGLAFGHEQAHAIRDTSYREPADAPAFAIRRATHEDIDEIRPLVRLIYEAHSVAPVFAYIEPSWYEELVPGHLELLRDASVGYFVAEGPEELLGYAAMRPIPEAEATLVKPAGSIELIVAATTVEARGRGVMRSLVQHALDWSSGEGFSVCVTDWRVPNLGSSRVWPALGFEPCAYRLHRIIDPRVIEGRRSAESAKA